jgi:hypothetical protein
MHTAARIACVRSTWYIAAVVINSSGRSRFPPPIAAWRIAAINVSRLSPGGVSSASNIESTSRPIFASASANFRSGAAALPNAI